MKARTFFETVRSSFTPRSAVSAGASGSGRGRAGIGSSGAPRGAWRVCSRRSAAMRARLSFQPSRQMAGDVA